MSRFAVQLHRSVSRLVHGYGAVLRAVATVAAVLAATVAIAVAGVYPLWFLATRARNTYTAVISAALIGLLGLLVYKRARALFEAVRHEELPRGMIARRARAVAVVFLVVALAYLTAVLAANARYAAAVAVGIVLLLTIGLPAGRIQRTDADSS